MEIIKTENGYNVIITDEEENLTITEDCGYYYCNGYEFDSWEQVTAYCEKLDNASIALSACSGWFFNECGELEKNISIFNLYSVTYAYLDSKEAVQLFANYTTMASEAGILRYDYEPCKYTSEAFLVLDPTKGSEEYEEHRDEDILLDIFKALIKKSR